MKYKFLALAGAAALIAAGAPVHINQNSTESVSERTFDFTSSRYAPAVQIEVSQLLNTQVTSADTFGHGHVRRLSFNQHGQPEWAWLQFGDYLNHWMVRAPMDTLYFDRQTGELISRLELKDLKFRAETDIETDTRTATRLSAEYVPASRLMGVAVVDEDGDYQGRVHSVEITGNGAVESVKIEAGFGVLGLKQNIVNMPAGDLDYLPVLGTVVMSAPSAPQFAAIKPGRA